MSGGGKHALKVKRFRRCATGNNVARADFVADGADDSAGLIRGLENVANHEGGGGFPVGAGDADDIQRVGGMPVKGRGNIGHGRAGAGGADAGDARRQTQAGLVDNGHGAFAHGFVNISAAIRSRAGQREKKSAGRDLAGVVGQRGNLRRRVAGETGACHTLCESAEFHGASA